MRLEITLAAVADLRSIRQYTLSVWGERQEAAYLDRLWHRFQAILDDPAAHRSRDDLFPGCRMAAEGRHVIFFRIQGDILQIVRVLHSAMDFRRHLSA